MTDDKSDGYCGDARVWWSDGGYTDTGRACARGNPNRNSWTHTDLNKIYVG